jgi:hypothetical protein
VEIKVGLKYSARDITIHSSESPAALIELIRRGLQTDILELTDERGNLFLVPSGAVGFIEIASNEQRRVGFSTD